MIMKKIKLILPVMFLGFLISCTKTSPSTSNLYTPTSADVTANATLSELQDGRTLYIDNCGRCHDLYSPDDLSVSGWKNAISSMSPKTSLNAAQVTLVTKYVTRGKQ
jgi:hypothetical protein